MKIVKNLGLNIPLAIEQGSRFMCSNVSRRSDNFEKQAARDFAMYEKTKGKKK